MRVTPTRELCRFGFPLLGLAMLSRPTRTSSRVLENGHVATPIFADWMPRIFIPELMKRRGAYSYHGPPFLILDNCSAHTNADFTDLCSLNVIVPVFLPPHSSNQSRVLDLSIFGITKGLIGRVNRIDPANVQSFHVAHVVCSFLSAANPANIIHSFRDAGISVVIAEDRLLCMVTPEPARCLLGARRY
jgi:hypothetical protein